jgi:hypothetical protein
MAMLNSEVYNRLNRLLFRHKVNRGCNIKKLPIPILDDEHQLQMEHFEGNEVMLAE